MSRSARRFGGLVPAALVLTLGLAAAPGRADETLLCNVYITSVPYTVMTQGHYCFDRNLSTAITTGAAITISADFVTLDLNGFKLGGGAAGLGTLTSGVFANNRQNLVIRNGNIRGFASGVRIDGSSSKAIVVEDLRLDENTTYGVLIAGSNHVVRNNAISTTGGNTSGTPVRAIGGNGLTDRLQLINNSIVQVIESSPATGDADAINVIGGGTSVLVVNNRIVDVVDDGIAAGGSICKDNIVTGQGGTAIACTFEVGTTNFP